jgi:glutathione S-transferase
MSLTLYYNPQSRARTTRWLLEELGVRYALAPVSYEDGSMRSSEFLALNPMGKIPVIVDDGVAVTESVAIAIYLCDKYKSPNDLAPALHDPLRGPYLRWLVYYAAGLEPAMTQKLVGFELNPRTAGWGSYEQVVSVLKDLLAKADPWILGKRFTAVDVVLGNGVSFGMQIGAFPKELEFTAYCDRLLARPAYARANEAS